MDIKQDRIDDYITTYTGVKFYPLNPRPEDVNILDISHALSNIGRFTGHGKRFLSVAEHSLNCAELLEKLTNDPKLILYGLLHDASEAYCNDVARPLKQHLPNYIEIEKRIQQVIYEALGLPQPTEEEYKMVKLVDDIMLINECKQLLPQNAELNLPKIEWKKEYEIEIPLDQPNNYMIRHVFYQWYDWFSALFEQKG